MKKMLLVFNPIYPRMDHNAKLLLRIVPYVDSENEIITLNGSLDDKAHPKQLSGIRVYFAKKTKKFDASVLHVCKVLLLAFYRKIKMKPNAVISTYQPRFAPIATSLMGRKVRKALYLMDPTEAMINCGTDVKSEDRWFLKMLRRYDVVFTTRFIKETMLDRGYGEYAKRIVEVSFPMVTGFSVTQQRTDEKITLFFGGSLCYSFRSPEYFFKIVSNLDERFRIIFVGDGCQGIFDRYEINTKAEVIGLHHVEYEKMLQMIADSDILINIGNSVPVHIPSKTLEYINTGKPIINFYKIDDCPTLYYTNRYPLSLNLDERDSNIDEVTTRLIDFCINSKGKIMQQQWIVNEYAECTPKEIAKTIENELFNN